MQYNRTLILKDGKELLIRNGLESDGYEVWEVFNQTHAETDYLLTYPEENSFPPEEEAKFLKEKESSNNEIELLALIDGKVIGMAGIESMGNKIKLAHRAEFGISILKDYWGFGIGKILMNTCIECARTAGYLQLELNVVADNSRAFEMYQRAGFIEYGRNPRGFITRDGDFQEVIYMRLEL